MSFARDTIKAMIDELQITEMLFDEEPYCGTHEMTVWDVKNSSNESIACSEDCSKCDKMKHRKSFRIEGF